MDVEELTKLDRDTLLAMVKEEIKKGSEDLIPYPPPLSRHQKLYKKAKRRSHNAKSPWQHPLVTMIIN